MTNTNEDTITCYRHPDRETVLMCNKCEKPICTSCAVLTPIGYRCKECVRGQQKVFDTARVDDFIIAAIVSFAISLAGSFVARFISFFTLFIAPLASMLISSSIQGLIKGRRSDSLRITSLVFAALGSLVFLLLNLLTGLLAFRSLYALLPYVWQVGYTIILVTTLNARLKGLYFG